MAATVAAAEAVESIATASAAAATATIQLPLLITFIRFPKRYHYNLGIIFHNNLPDEW